MLPASFLNASLGKDKSTILTKVTYSYYFWCSQEEDVVVTHFLASGNPLQMLGSNLEYYYLKTIKMS